jgi:hypothetical protein
LDNSTLRTIKRALNMFFALYNNYPFLSLLII